MTSMQMHNSMMSMPTASFCDTAASAARSARHMSACNNSICVILDAIVMASSIIASISLLGLIRLSILVLVLVLVGLLVTQQEKMPWMRTFA